MYEENEVAISRKYLHEVLVTIDEPIVLLGGWAVYYLVNEAYIETTGRNYVGSRDIDLGFTFLSSNLDDSTFIKTLKKLEEDLDFEPLSFRLFKEMHLETGESISPGETKKTPSYMIFPLYVDMIVDRIPGGFAEQYGFTPIDEPLLSPIFADPKNRTEIDVLGKHIWLPTPKMMLAMKIKSYPDRTKDHKKIKDISDISALLLFSTIKREAGILDNILAAMDIHRFKTTLNVGDIRTASDIIGIDSKLAENAILNVVK